MSDPVAAFRAANALDVPAFAPTSRYYGLATTIWTAPDGTEHAYVRRRLLPDPANLSTLGWATVVEGDRPDLLAQRLLGDAAAWWRLADANGAFDPGTLTAQPGTRVRVTLPAGTGLPNDD